MAKIRRALKQRPIRYNCYFCQEKKTPSYKDLDAIRRFITERGKILARQRTGTCAKHQRKLTIAIKHARHLALLPFIVRAY